MIRNDRFLSSPFVDVVLIILHTMLLDSPDEFEGFSLRQEGLELRVAQLTGTRYRSQTKQLQAL
jgi:hypothetical protein